MNFEKLKTQVIGVAQEAGSFIGREYENFDPKAIEYKGFNNMVSYVDKTAEKMIVDALTKLFPEAGVIAEEGSGTPNPKGYNWIIDPLDGTTNFVHGIPCFCVSIALANEAGVQIGVIYDPLHKSCYHATKTGAAYCNDKELCISADKPLSAALVATGFPYCDFERLPQYMAIIEQLICHSHGMRRMGSAAIDLAYVAAGKLDAFFEYNLNAWDVAAGILLVERAGGKVTDFRNGNDVLFGKQIIAAPKSIHTELQKIIEKAFF